MKYFISLGHSRRADNHHLHLRARWQLWAHRYKTRKDLQTILRCDPERMHHDLGLSTETALAEINKPFWRG